MLRASECRYVLLAVLFGVILFESTPSGSLAMEGEIDLSRYHAVSPTDDSYLTFRIRVSPVDLHLPIFSAQLYLMGAGEYPEERGVLERISVGGGFRVGLLRYFHLGARIVGTHYEFDLTHETSRNRAARLGEGWTPEGEALFEFRIPLFDFAKRPLALFGSDTYTFNLRDARGVLNRIEGGVEYSPLPWGRLAIGWRHEDVIKGPDADQFLMSCGVRF